MAGTDQGNRGEPDAVAFTNVTPGALDIFLVVDSFYGEDFSWNLTWSISGP